MTKMLGKAHEQTKEPDKFQLRMGLDRVALRYLYLGSVCATLELRSVQSSFLLIPVGSWTTCD